VNFIINPGTGQVSRGVGSVLWRNADRNMTVLMRDAECGSDCRLKRAGAVDEHGRYPYLIVRGRRRVDVDMPGLKLELVRLGEHDNAWFFPRLYVDGSSWLWPYAVSIVRDFLKLGSTRPTRTP